MSQGPVATASVRIVPDLTGFQALLQTEVNKAVNAITVPTIKANVAATAAATTIATGGTRASTGAATASALAGTKALTTESNALRGAIIGLSRVTPVTVFGLGVYGTAAIAAGYAIKGALRSTADFEHQLNIFQATTGASAREMRQVEEEAKRLGADLSLPSTSAGDAAQALTELAKAGLTVNQSLAGVEGVLQLAAAAQLDVGSAATFVATELNAFGLAGDQATHVADLLAGASIAAQGDIRDFGTAFQQVSAVSHQVDLSLETTTGALTELARAGLRGADAGTSLRTFLLRLAPTTKQAAEYQKALGIEIDKNRSIGAQLPQLIEQYRTALEGLSPVIQQQALTQIFGQDAIRAASILINGGSAALRENTKAANQNGAAAKLAAANAKGLSGAVSGLKSNADTLGITLGNLVKGPLTLLVKSLSESVTFANNLAEGLIDLAGATKRFGESLPLVGKGGRFEGFFGGLKDSVEKGAKLAFLPSAVNEAINHLKSESDRFHAAIEDIARSQQPLPPGIFEFQVPINIVAPGEGSQRPTAAQAAAAARAAATEARIKALEEAKKQKKILPADTTAPNRLEIKLLEAQLAGNLQAELTADKAIEAYFQKRLSLAKKGTDRYVQILGALQQAHAATTAVQDEIANNAAAVAAAAKADRDKAVADQKQQAAAAAAAANALFDLQKSRFDLQIQRATTLFPNNIALARRAYKAEIAFLNDRIKQLQGIRKKTTEQRQEIVNLQSDIVSLKGAIRSLNKAAKPDASSSGFSLRQLFAEAQSTFNQFGSNVSGSVATAGGVRGAFAGAILSGKDNLTNLEKQKLQQAATTNTLLAQILSVLRIGTGAAERTIAVDPHDPIGPAGFATAAHARDFTRLIG